MTQPAATVRDLLLEACHDADGRIAVIDRHTGTTLTYGQLLDEVGRREVTFAGHRDGLVVLETGHRLEAMLDLLAAMYAGRVAVPIDLQTPARRRDSMLEQLARLRIGGADHPAGRAVHPDDAALVYFTSGSSGTPKAVPLAHRGICTFTRDIVTGHRIRADDRILMASTADNDFFLEEILMTVGARAATVILPAAADVTDSSFPGWLEANQVTILDLPTARWRVLAASLRDNDQVLPGVVRRVIIGGEALRPEDLDVWREGRCGDATLCNAYGPTETTVVSTVFELPAGYRGSPSDSVPIGEPLPGVATVVARNGHVADAGEVGELLIGGDILALGYWAQPGLTAERFVPDWVSGDAGRRLYRTGDLVRREASGALVFVGRIDDQVKIRGHRVEPGEVERVLGGCHGVDEVAVVARPDAAGEPRLVAFIAGTAAPGQVSDWATRHLPSWMCPARIVPLDRLPHTSTGKVDRGSLTVPSDELAPTALAPPAGTATQAVIADVWREVLGLPQIGPRDNFFAIGGHSLKAMQAAVRLRRVVDSDVQLADFFRAPILADFASLLDSRSAQRGRDA